MEESILVVIFIFNLKINLIYKRIYNNQNKVI